jgi:transcriptional regulator with XRE-family HTH domain
MEEAGQKLKRARERLNLRYRDVEEASIQIAERRRNDDFIIALSRLADIENKGTVPTIFRLYSLCAIYRLDVLEVLEWYGVDVATLPADAVTIPIERTHLIGFGSTGSRSGRGSAQDHLFEPDHTTLGQDAAGAAQWTGYEKSPVRFHRLGGLVHVPDRTTRRAGADR